MLDLTTVMLLPLGGVGIFLAGMLVYKYMSKGKTYEDKSAVKAAYIDALTGLGNRHKFNKVIAEMVKHEQDKFALCFLDLDDFKHINDNMGHDAGDELLIELGKRLVEGLEDHGQVFRLGGDEYALIITNADTKLEVETVVKRVKRNVARPIDLRGNIVNLEYSLGVAMFPEDTKDSVQLINYADTAMYHIKESGKSDYYFHNAALKAQTENKKRMERELKEAYEKKEFGIEYQPRINVKNPKEIWLEAFVYWKHPVVGKLRAEYFLKFAETIGIVIGIDEIMIEQALDDLKSLNKLGILNVNMALNVSIRHFQRKDFVDRLCNVLENHKEQAKCMMLQIANNVGIDKIESYKVMFEKIRAYGVKISISNYEVKHEVLDVFKRLNLDEVKVSSKFLESNSIFNENVLKDIVTLSKDLGYQVVVTKIENEETLKKVLKLKPDKVQGNYISRILDKNELEEYLLNATKKTSKKK